MIDGLLDAIGESVESLSKKFYGVVTGRVVNLADPLGLGRVQVQLPFQDAIDLQSWARVATPMTGLLHGHYFLPNLNDEVLVAFEHGEMRAPYIIGSLWNAFAPPPLPSPLAEIRALRTMVGNQLAFTEAPPSVTVQSGPTPIGVIPSPPSAIGPYSTVQLSPDGIVAVTGTSITLQVGESSITITPTGIDLQSAGNFVSLGPDGITISAVGPLNITSAGPCSVSAPVIELN